MFLPELMCLRRATCPSYSLFPRCRIGVRLLNWIQKETKLHVQHLACPLLWPNNSTMGHIVLDLASLAYQPKSREWSSRPTKHVTFALSQRKSAYPAQTRELDEEEEEDQPFVRSDGSADSEDEDDKPLVHPTSRKAPIKEKRESAPARRNPTQVRIRKRTSSLARPVCQTGTRSVRKLA